MKIKKNLSNLSLHEYILCAKSYGFKTAILESPIGGVKLVGRDPFFTCPYERIESCTLSTTVAHNAFNDLF